MKLVLGAAAAAVFAVAAAEAKRPSFIVLFADDMGYSQPSNVSDRSGFAGDNGTISTPNLDEFAAEGVTFTSWYSAHHVCSPSRFSMMTGRLPVRGGIGLHQQPNTNGVFTSEAVGGIPQNETTIAEVLSDNGYGTYMVGKWHLGQTEEHLPTKHGFDYYYGIPFSCDMGISAWQFQAEDRPPFHASPLPLIEQDEVIEQPTNLATLTERYVNQSIKYLHEASQTPDKPFYMYVAFNHIHTPWFASKAFCNTSSRGMAGDAAQEMDHAVGQIMAAAKDLGIDEDVVWFFTSDNGAPVFSDEYGNGPLRDGKTTTWEGGVREPAAIRWKGHIEPGQISDSLVGTYDIFPTILSIANISTEAAFAPKADIRLETGHSLGADSPVLDGRDLSPILFESTTSEVRDCLMLYYSPQDADVLNTSRAIGAVRCGDYKAHYFTETSRTVVPAVPDGVHDPPLLYNLASDIGESHPIDPTSDEYKKEMQTINAALQAHLETVDLVPCQMVSQDDGCNTTNAPECVGGSDISARVCKDPHSPAKYPQWPNCTSNPEYYGTAECRQTHPQCIAECMPESEQGWDWAQVH